MNNKRGETVLVLFPDSSLQTAKRRPALVVQAENLNSGLQQTIVAMISSNMKRAGHLSRVTLKLGSVESHGSGLRTDSVVMTDNLATILDSEIDRKIGSLTNMDAVDAALRYTLGLANK